MTDFVSPVAAWCAGIIEMIGVAAITLIALYALIIAGMRMVKKDAKDEIFEELRQTLGRGILLGLEFLIAADVIYMVAVELTFQSVGVLTIVVLIRTFLSFTLELEMTGKWLWQNDQKDEK